MGRLHHASSDPGLARLTSPSSHIPLGRIVSKDEIRILDLLPGNGDDDIECDIRVVAVSGGELYEALSYVWGETGDKKAIRVSGRETKITHNLNAALQRLRHPTKTRPLWVDQLCINQWDNDEKAEQVNLMRLIYKRCSQCLIWLGEIVEQTAGFSIQDAHNAFNFIHVVAANSYHPTRTAPPAMLASNAEGEGARKAFRGMVMHGNPCIPSCNYNISPAILYSRVTLDLIRLESCLRPLVGFRGEPHVTPTLPTWALDLTCYDYGIKKRPWEWWKHSHRYGYFYAGGSRPLECASLSNEKVLSLTGVFVDKITVVGVVLGEETWGDLSDSRLIRTILSWEVLLHQFINSQKAGKTYVGGGSWVDAFWRTMLGDLVMKEFPIGRAVNACLFEFKKFLIYRTRSSIYQSLRDMVINQAFFITVDGYIGIGPPNSQVGDEVWVLFGGRVPFVLRPDGGGAFVPPKAVEAKVRFFIGDTYVHGIMDGEAVKDCQGEGKTVLLC
ncbi:hypothetical protein N431DRAFT_424407 [Stipitochalara longipes BDJ]|nr:hypothetical protein N431DRAFT_424407 [Stipitochalara longipes BDJ]